MKIVGQDITAEERWKEIASTYLEKVEGAYHIHRRKVIQSLYSGVDVEGANILDFGCGEGNIIKSLLKNGPKKIYGIDINENLIHAAQENLKNKTNIELVKGSISNLSSISDNSLDLIFALNVIGYFSNEEEVQFYNEVVRILKKGGGLIVCHSNLLFDLFTFNRHTVNFVVKNFTGGFSEEIASLLKNPSAPKKVSANIRENPLAYKFKMKRYGLTEVEQAFANFHEIPPLLMDENLFYEDLNEREYADTTNWKDEDKWKLLFQCSMFASRLEKN